VGKVCRAEDVAVVMVAHDINPILGYVDEVVYLAGGRAAAGPPRDVITDRTLTQLYGTPVEVLTTSAGRLVVLGTAEEATSSDHRHHP
jgi:zinc/manganese transport system ATP-binding protein